MSELMAALKSNPKKGLKRVQTAASLEIQAQREAASPLAGADET